MRETTTNSIKQNNSFEQDIELVNACIRGDVNAQNRFYCQYSKPMFGLCHRMIGNKQDAEDVFQNAFISVFSKLKTYKAKAPLIFWIRRIFVNQCIDELKNKKEFLDFDESYLEVVVEEDLNVDYSVQSIKNAVSKLATGYRTILSLYLFEGYDHGEIANFLGISESTSKSQYSRARLKLKQLLTNER